MTLIPMLESRPLEGTIFNGRYRIEHQLGAGGMGAVYRAQPLDGGPPVAIKLLLSGFDHHYAYRQRFIREARVASSIAHPNVTRVLDFGQTAEGRVFSVMEYLPGEDLRQRLRREGPLSWSKARTILRQVLRGLRAAHEMGVLHRDIKPSNVFLVEGREGQSDYVKLLDFGLAKAVDPASSLAEGLTRMDEVLGTAQYMPPERILGEPADARSDQYSLGVMAFRMLSGELPPGWGKGTTMGHLLRRTTSPPPALADRLPNIPLALDALVRRSMACDPDQRFSSLRALDEAMMKIPLDGRRPTTAPYQQARAHEDAPTQSMAWTRTLGVKARTTLPITLSFAAG